MDTKQFPNHIQGQWPELLQDVIGFSSLLWQLVDRTYMLQAQNLFDLKQEKLTHEMCIGMQVVLVVKNQSWDLIRHSFLRCFCYCNWVIRKYQLMLKMLAGEDFLRWLWLPCKAGDTILVASKKTNVTVWEI